MARRGYLRFLLVLYLIPLLVAGSPIAQATTRPSFGYGIVVSNSANYPEVTKLGFGYVKLFVGWNAIEPQQGVFSSGGYPDSAVNAALANNLKIVALIFDTPGWANGTGVYNSADPPPSSDHVADFGVFLSNLAAHYQGKIYAYEIWNEPNVSGTWGNQNPDPTRFVAMLQSAYPAIKGADSAALVVSGGLANTGAGNGGSAIGDLIYLQDMLQDGALGSMDAIGIHPYPGACDPTATSCAATPGTYFQRANEEHNTVVQFGGGNLPMWITEVGYFSVPSVLDPNAASCPQGGNTGIGNFNTYEVSEANKAAWVVDAYNLAYNDWPWLGMFMLMNLDISMDSYSARASCDPARFWAILTSTGQETQAYTALENMPKLVQQMSITSLPSNGGNQASGTVTINGSVTDASTGAGVAIDEVTATIDTPSGSDSPLVTPIIGTNGTFQVLIDVTTLTAYVTHQVYINAHNATNGWLSATTGVFVQPMMTGSIPKAVFLYDPSHPSSTIFAVTLGRNDGNSQQYQWSDSIVYGSGASGWISGSPQSIGSTFTGTVNPRGLKNGQYTATVTIINCPSSGCSTPPYFVNQVVVPVVLIIGPIHNIFVPLDPSVINY